MRVFLTGANGFIGAATVRAFIAAGAEVGVVLRSQSERSRLAPFIDHLTILEGSMEDLHDWQPLLSDFRADAIVHSAWYAEPGKYATSPKNEDSYNQTVTFAQAAADMGGIRFYGIGTCFEYDFSQGTLTESSALGPNTVYGEFKRKASDFVLGIEGNGWIRPFYQYGPQEDPRRLIPAVIRSVLSGQSIDVIEGHMKRDYSHVEDVGGGIAAVVMAGLSGVTNLGSGEAPTVRHILETIGELAGRPDLINFGGRTSNFDEPELIVSGGGRLAREAGFTPRFGLRDGLEDTVRWWREHLNQAT